MFVQPVGDEGLPLIVLHGGPGLDHIHLRPWLDPLGEEFRVFYVDERGQGQSERVDPATLSLEVFARDVDRLAEALGLDRFALLAFDNVIEAPPELGDGLRVAGDHARFQAVEFLSRLAARGGTEMAAPLTRALDLLTGPAGGEPAGRDLALVLVTDGQVGNEDQLLRLLAPRLGGVRVYTVGVDTAVNEGFLKRLAGLGGGACELVESEDRLDAVMERVHRRIGAPVLTGLELEPAGLDLDRASLAPRRLADLFAGSPLVVSGRFEGDPSGAVVVRGRDAAGQPWSATVSLNSLVVRWYGTAMSLKASPSTRS